MYNVLIVEDEILVSIGLKNMINWSEMGMQVIAEAQDGKTAFEIYKEQKPDLILTDIKMPVMDGLELIAKIRETDKKTKIIILTCYQEFDLIHKALKLGVSDYILKLKMSVSEMESVIMKVHDELVTTDAVQLENISLPIVQLAKNQFLLDYVLHGSFTDAAFEKMISGMHLRIDSSRLVLCVMRISNFESVNRQPDGDPKNTVADTILNLVDKLLAKYLRGEVVRQNDGQYLIIFSFGDIVSETKRTELLYSILSRISVNMKTYINASVTFGISLCRDGYSCLRELYNQAIKYAIRQSKL